MTQNQPIHPQILIKFDEQPLDNLTKSINSIILLRFFCIENDYYSLFKLKKLGAYHKICAKVEMGYCMTYLLMLQSLTCQLELGSDKESAFRYGLTKRKDTAL